MLLAASSMAATPLQMDKARVLEGYLIETGGTIDSFDPIAEGLLEDNPAIQNVLFAPQGIVTAAFPAAGNEATIGLDLNSSGQGICGRLPVFLQGEYWGLVSVTLSYPEIFVDHPIHHVNEQGFAAQVWRINPDTNQKQVILETEKSMTDRMMATQYKLQFFNADWTIELASLTAWYQRPMLWIMVLASILVSALVSFGVESDHEIRRMRAAEAAQQIQILRQQLEWEQTNIMINQISTHFLSYAQCPSGPDCTETRRRLQTMN